MRSTSKPLLIIFILYLLGVGFAITLAVLTFPGEVVHEAYTSSYILSNTVVNFFHYLFAFHGAGILLAFSLFVSEGDMRAKGPSIFAAARSTVIVIILLSLFYTLGVIWIMPSSRARMSVLKERTLLAEELAGDVHLYEESRQYSRAVGAMESYVRLVGRSDEAEMRLENLRSQASEQALAVTPRQEAEEPGRLLRTDVEELSPAELENYAQEYYEEGEYYSAHYYADLAVQLSDTPRTSAQRLANRAWEQITSYVLSAEEEGEADYFRRKREAYEAFQAGQRSEESLIDAYYRLRALQQERAGDPDVERYLGLTRERLRQVSFFLEDAEAARAYPGTFEIIGINDRSATEWEVFRIGKMVWAEGVEYLYDIEVVRFDHSGEVLFHFGAPYGKIIGSAINMQAISKDSAQTRMVPTFLEGERPGELSFMYEIAYSPEELAIASTGVERREEAHIGRLLTLHGLAQRLGLPQEPLELELFLRIGGALLFVALSFLFLGVGWGLRSHYMVRPPAAAMLLLPLLPVVAAIFFLLLRYVFRIVSASLLVSYSSTTAALLGGILLLLLLLVALYSVARQTVD